MINLLVLYDIDGYAYWRRALALSKYAASDFAVMIAPWQRVIDSGLDVNQFDIVFSLDFALRRRFGAMPHVMSFNADSHRRQEWWDSCRKACDYMICNNREVYTAHGRQERTCNISNGIDTDIFRCIRPIEARVERVFWTGSPTIAKGKGYDLLQLAKPIMIANGFIPEFHPVNAVASQPFDTEQIVRKYNDSAYVVCMSASEGTPGTSLEGMACGCALVSTRCGNVLEFGKDGENCILIDRSVDGLIDGLVRAREKRVDIASAGEALMRTKWSYGAPGNRAKVFFDLFRRIVNDGPETIAPFSYDETGVAQ